MTKIIKYISLNTEVILCNILPNLKRSSINPLTMLTRNHSYMKTLFIGV